MNVRPMRMRAPELRTRPPVPVTTPRPEPRRCYYCRATLRTGNLSTICAPCEAAGYPEMVDPEPEDLDAPFCLCGCGERTLRLLQSHNGKPQRTGPYQRFVKCHNNSMRQKGGKAKTETESRTAPEEAVQTAQAS